MATDGTEGGGGTATPPGEEEVDFQIRTRDNKYTGFDEEKEQAWAGPFCFVQSADTQFGFIDLIAGKTGKDITWDEEIELTKKAIAAANRMRPLPRFFIVCGDLVDALPGDPNKGPQERAFKRTFQGLNSAVPLVCVCGNHDVGNRPTRDSVQHYRDTFGDDYFSFWVGGVKFIVINSQYYKDGSLIPTLVAEQDAWLERELADANARGSRHIVLFQHVPWFLSSPSEENDPYFNIDRELRQKMLDKFKAAGVRTIFCGHYHRNAGGFDESLEVVVTTAIGAQLGDDKSGVRIVRVLENQIEHKYYDLDRIPQKVEMTNTS